MSAPPPLYPSFSTVAELWQSYCERILVLLPPSDPRQILATEVRERISLLDECLELVSSTIATLQSDPILVQAQFRYLQEFGPKLRSGEVSNAAFGAKMPRSNVAPMTMIKSYRRIRLFTESFYFVAWRLREVVNSGPPRDFPHLGNLNETAVRNVRNLLLQHPETRKESPVFEQHMVITDNGPILKSMTIVVNLDAGKTSADSESLDKGLYENARAFESEFRHRLLAALK